MVKELIQSTECSTCPLKSSVQLLTGNTTSKLGCQEGEDGAR